MRPTTEAALLAATQENSAFSKELPGLQIAWDSTSLGELKSCPYRYYLGIINSWQPKAMADPLAFGIYVHSTLEAYDKARVAGASHEDAQELAVKAALEMSGHWEDFDTEANSPRVGTFQPWQSQDNRRTRETLVRVAVWYTEHYLNDAAETVILENGKAAVELSFRFGFGREAPTGEDYLLCGHFDKIVDFAGEKYSLDRKTTGSTISPFFFKKFSPDNQMSLYTLAGQVAFGCPTRGVIVDGIQLAVNFCEFCRGFATRTPGQVNEWLDDTLAWIALAEHFALERHWPMNDKSCGQFGGCKFQGVCSKDPSTREQYLKVDFEKRMWNPLQTRET